MSADRWLTYADAATLLGMTVDSLRHRARRDHWGKRISNEGKALVLVPLDAVRIPAGGAPGETAGDPPASRPARRPEPDLVAVYVARIAELERRIADLRTDLDGARQERDRERDERHAERDRADRIAADLAEIARQLSGCPRYRGRAVCSPGPRRSRGASAGRADGRRGDVRLLDPLPGEGRGDRPRSAGPRTRRRRHGQWLRYPHAL